MKPAPASSRNRPLLRLRTGVCAGQSLNACMKNLKYWQDAYTRGCGSRSGV